MVRTRPNSLFTWIHIHIHKYSQFVRIPFTMVNSRVHEMMQLMVLVVETMMVMMQLTGLVIMTMILTHRCHHLSGPAHLVPGLVVVMILHNSVIF